MRCKNCGHEIVKTKTYNGYEHVCECILGSHLMCRQAGDENQYNECECEKPEPEEKQRKQAGERK